MANRRKGANAVRARFFIDVEVGNKCRFAFFATAESYPALREAAALKAPAHGPRVDGAGPFLIRQKSANPVKFF